MEKTKRKFNLVDALVIIAIIAVLTFVFLKLKPTEDNKEETAEHQFQVVFYTGESPDFALDRIEVGDPVCDADNNIEFGEVTEKPELGAPEIYIETTDGKYIQVEKEGYSSAKITFQGKGTAYAYGVKFDFGKYSVGQSVSLRVGDTKLYGRVYDIQQLGD